MIIMFQAINHRNVVDLIEIIIAFEDALADYKPFLVTKEAAKQIENIGCYYLCIFSTRPQIDLISI